DAAQLGAAAPASNRGIPGTPPSATLDAKNGAPQAQPSPGLAPAPNLSIPTSAQEQLQAEVRCNAQVAEACESAALSVEQGLFGTKDLKRATMLRRIALTLYVKQCEGGRPSSCEQLARMYERGDLKLPNPRTVQALAQRIHELCQKHGEDPVCANPRPIPP
ncbi:MAG TPA: hypothetical protein VFQ61_07495, partial [Polyangiaceae bacterium]|nr:hypothetical protein [Polyangiaceae bacterium]